MKTFYILANPNAGSGQGQIVYKRASQYLQERGIPFTAYISNYQYHAIELTKQIIQRAKQVEKPIIIVIGGDGTLHEVVAGLHQANFTLPICYLPAGTGNDFARTWQYKQTYQDLLGKALLNLPLHYVPIFHLKNMTTQEEDIVLNSIGFGLDGKVISKTSKISHQHPLKKVFRGKLAYWLAAIQAGMSLPSFSMSIDQEDKVIYYHRCHLAGFFNSPYFGGGIRISPSIQGEDPYINMILFHNLNTFHFIQYFIKIVLMKRDIHHDKVIRLKSSKIRFTIQSPTQSQVDGELRPSRQETIELSMGSFPFIH